LSPRKKNYSDIGGAVHLRLTDRHPLIKMQKKKIDLDYAKIDTPGIRKATLPILAAVILGI